MPCSTRYAALLLRAILLIATCEGTTSGTQLEPSAAYPPPPTPPPRIPRCARPPLLGRGRTGACRCCSTCLPSHVPREWAAAGQPSMGGPARGGGERGWGGSGHPRLPLVVHARTYVECGIGIECPRGGGGGGSATRVRMGPAAGCAHSGTTQCFFSTAFSTACSTACTHSVCLQPWGVACAHGSPPTATRVYTVCQAARPPARGCQPGQQWLQTLKCNGGPPFVYRWHVLLPLGGGYPLSPRPSPTCGRAVRQWHKQCPANAIILIVLTTTTTAAACPRLSGTGADSAPRTGYARVAQALAETSVNTFFGEQGRAGQADGRQPAGGSLACVSFENNVGLAHHS